MIALMWVLAILYLCGGLNDAFMDLVYYLPGLRRRLAQGRENPACAESELHTVAEKRIAILVPAWDESAVIGAMLESTCDRLEYSHYDIFVGTYPNDEATQMEVARAAFDRPNIHRVVCPNDGPTSKADCLNWIVETIKLRERESGERYEIFCLQDAEDVVHPLTLKVFNRFVPEYDLVQLPVIPYERGLGRLTGGTYLDEFAEVHLKGLIARLAVGGMVPSAGVGTAFSRAACDELAEQTNHVLFPPVSLTEDYDFSFRLFRNGRKSGIAEVWVDRADANGRAVKELVAIREFFPARFRDAIRQKQRWMLGITFQGAQKLGWGRGWRERYMLLRDRLGPPTSVLNLLAVFVLFRLMIEAGFGMAHHHTWQQSVAVYYPGRALAVLVDINLALLLNRIAQRARFVGLVASRRQMLLAPVRILWSNLIDFYCTFHAVRRFTHSRASGKPLKWLKTAHEFPNVEALLQRHRPLGDLLLEHRFISPVQLRKALGLQSRAPDRNEPLGQILIAIGAITQDQLLQVLAMQRTSRTLLEQANEAEALSKFPAAHLAAVDLTPDLPASMLFAGEPAPAVDIASEATEETVSGTPAPDQAVSVPSRARPTLPQRVNEVDPARPLLIHPRRPTLPPATPAPPAHAVFAPTVGARASSGRRSAETLSAESLTQPAPIATAAAGSPAATLKPLRLATTPEHQATGQFRTAITRIVPSASTGKRYSMLQSVAARWTSSTQSPRRFVVAIGTRPEAIKLAPVIRELRQRAERAGAPDPVFVCTTGQHDDLVREPLAAAGIAVDRNLGLLTQGQSLATLSARVLDGFAAVLQEIQPEWVVVQGDTATTAMAGLAAFYAGIKVAHIEAGLRTGDLANPFPEEFSRRMVSLFAAVHFAATPWARQNLLREGVPPASIVVTGNTGIDALHVNAARLKLQPGRRADADAASSERPLRVLITAHRRENQEGGLENICRAVEDLARQHPGRFQFAWPLHPNPRIGDVVRRALGQTPGVTLTSPVSYDRLLQLMAQCDLILTDSGGIQEEAPSFGKPVLILREATERPEGVENGVAWLVGNNPTRIVAAVERLATRLAGSQQSDHFGAPSNPYGDGKSSERIADYFDRLPVEQFRPAAALQAGNVRVEAAFAEAAASH